MSPSQPSNRKTQCWKSIWPAPSPQTDTSTASRAWQMAKDAIPLNGAYEYNDKGEKVAPEAKWKDKEKEKVQSWKAVWPWAASKGDSEGGIDWEVAKMARDVIPLNGAYGYDEMGERVVPEKKKK